MKYKLKKYPKKPKASASLETMKKYLDRCKEIDRENAQMQKDKKQRETLKKKIQQMR